MGIVGRGLQRVNDYLEAPPRGPQYHGDKNDPRYPSPRELRGDTAAFFDIALHGGSAGAIANTAVSGLGWVVLVFVATYAALSFVHTVIVQRIIHATIGEALLGLVVIRGEDGGWPTFGNLVRGYFWRGFATAFCFFDDNDLPATASTNPPESPCSGAMCAHCDPDPYSRRLIREPIPAIGHRRTRTRFTVPHRRTRLETSSRPRIRQTPNSIHRNIPRIRPPPTATSRNRLPDPPTRRITFRRRATARTTTSRHTIFRPTHADTGAAS
ncbi:hypothetical protein ACIBG0_11980 [Nocardia sp. NPDC050630]|uniref:hypothetical protein n=1 Tax=Nocardia sp. NPDC050630 TaxID=3364321 RepID=UPI0037A028C5